MTSWKGVALSLAEEQAIDLILGRVPLEEQAIDFFLDRIQLPAPVIEVDVVVQEPEPVVESPKPNIPNPEAVGELYDRLIWFLATRETKKSVTQPKRQRRQPTIKA